MNTPQLLDLAQPTHEPDQTTCPHGVYGSFHLSNHELALPAERLHDVVHPPEVFAPQPMAPDYLLGVMTLRDMTVPVIDMRKMLGINDEHPELASMKIAVVEYGDFNVGMLFDDTGEVFRSERLRDRFTEYSIASTAGLVVGAFRLDDGERMIQVLDTAAIIEFEGAPLMPELTADTIRRRTRPPSRGPKLQSISFRAGNTELGINICAVQEIIKLEQFDDRMSTSDVFVGTTLLRDKPMALVDLAVALGMHKHPHDQPIVDRQVVVVEGAEQLTGLVVDEICDITQFYEDEMASFPVFSEEMPEIFLGSVIDASGKQILQIDALKLLQMDSVCQSLSRCGDIFDNGDDSQRANAVSTSEKRETYLTFRIDGMYGLPILDVAEVVDYPKKMLTPPLINDCVDGVLDLRGELIEVVNARRLYGMDDTASKSLQIIIFDRLGERFGIAIDSVESIAAVRTGSARPLADSSHHRANSINEDVTAAVCFTDKSSGKLRDILSLNLDAVAVRIKASCESADRPRKAVELRAV